MWKEIDEAEFAMIRASLKDLGGGETARGKMLGGGRYLELGRGGLSLIRREVLGISGQVRFFIWEASR
jgi:hypothetical protein